MNLEKIPFQETEMQSGLVYPSPFPGAPGILKPSYPISPRENFMRTLAGFPAWIPSDRELFMFAPADIGENRVRGMVIDAERIPVEQFGGKDFFGVDWVYVPEQTGSMVKPGNPLMEEACEWKEKVIFPDMSKWNWEGCAERNRFLLQQGCMIKTPLYTGFFERLVSFMDMSNALIALVDEDQQDDVKELFEALADFYIEYLHNMKKYFGIDIVWFHDDWGSQRAPMFSYETVEEMIAPYLKKVIDGAHNDGIIFEFHSCGKIDSLIPLVVEAGADLWDGQALNDRAALSKQYKGRLGIEVDLQTSPGMSDEELRESLRMMLKSHAPGIFLGKTFRADPRLTPFAYEESRKIYNS